MVKISLKISIFAVLLLLQACLGGSNYAPVIERKERAKTVPKEHSVKRGETLYSIAWRYNLDVRGLAGTNSISPPYLIFPEQKIALKRSYSPAKRSINNPPPTGSNMPKKLQNHIASSKKYLPKPTTKKKTTKRVQVSSSVRWQWPAKGKVDRTFSPAGGVHKGIDIKGKLGEPVHAAGSGKVVYAGSGLVGYGKLLIIKHNEHYLSAYGHNRKLLVAEGELVKEGQRIAEIGDTGTDKVKLHFEIRRNGKPVNPLKLLPRGR
jgi:lipoprotein NlpD